jgi:hypothetical protein
MLWWQRGRGATGDALAAVATDSGRLLREGDAQQRQQSKEVLLVLVFATVIVEEPLAKTT